MLDAIQNLTYSDSMHILTLNLIDGTDVDLRETKFSQSDTAALVGMTAMPTCILELNAVMPVLFPGIDEKLYFDVLNEQMAFYPSLFGESFAPSKDKVKKGKKEKDEKEKAILFSDEYTPMYILEVQRRLRDLGFTGKRYPPKEVCIDTLKYRAWNHQRNLFREWLESLKWDGKHRMRRWFIDGLGVTAPPLEGGGQDQIYLESATEAWFLGTISRQYKATKVEVVPVFIGGEGIGKGNFLRYTAGYNDDWFIDTSATLRGPGAEQKFLEGIKGRIIVELSESVQFSTKEDVELLKTFVSKTEDQSRKPYAVFSSSCVRRFTLVATSNQNNVFLDTGGGNRRYFPMYCDPNRAILPYDPQNKIIGKHYMEQVWAEAMYIYRNKESTANSFLSKQVAELAAVMQDYGTRENTPVSVIDEWLDDPANGYAELGSRVSKAFIFGTILGVDPKGMIPKSAEYAYNTWANIQKCWRKITQTCRVNGEITHCAYERIHTREELREKKRSNMVSVVPGKEGEFIDVVGIVRSRAQTYKCSKCGDPFPTEGLTEEELKALEDCGYIYMLKIGDYRLGMLP